MLREEDLMYLLPSSLDEDILTPKELLFRSLIDEMNELQIKIQAQHKYIDMLKRLNSKKGFNLEKHIHSIETYLESNINKYLFIKNRYPNLILGKKIKRISRTKRK